MPGIGGNDAALLAHWPGLLYDNTSDYINWGFAAARQNYPTDPLHLDAADLVRLTLAMTPTWHRHLRTLIAQTDLSTCFPINIRTSVPLDPWPTSRVTLLGDAIHTMTPGRGVGANTALRDAAALCRALTTVRDGAQSLHQAVHEYEAAMIKYGFAAVLASRQQMDGHAAIHQPVIGRLALAGMRSGMRVVNALPPLRRRMAESQQRFRGADRDTNQPSAPEPSSHETAGGISR